MQSRGTVALVGGAPLAELRRAVARRGLRAVAIGVPEAMPEIPDEPVILAKEVVDYSQTLAVTHRLVELGRQHDFLGIVPVSEYGLLSTAMAALRLGLPTLSLTVVGATRDKVRMRRVLDGAGVPQPRWASCRTLEDAQAFQQQLGAAMVVKSAWGSGSDSVSRVDEPADLAAALERVQGSRSPGPMLCEEYVEGPEVSLEACTVDGRFVPIAVTDKLVGRNFIEVGHQQPSSLAPSAVREVHDYAERALAALGVDRSVSHSEFRLTEHGPMLIETHTRMGGGSLHLLTEQTTGVDMAELMVALALGERPKIEPETTGRGCAIRFLIDGPGQVAKVTVPEVVSPELLATELRLEVGQRVGECRSSFERLGSALAVGPTVAAAARTAEQFLDRIEIEWQDEPRRRRAGSRRR